MRKILIAALVLTACKKPEPHGEFVGADGTPSVKPTQTAAAVVQPKPAPPVPTPLEEVQSKKTFAEALAFSKPKFQDTQNKADAGALLLAAWMADKKAWADINALPETSVAKVLKDSDEERGKRLCASGTIIEIAKTKTDVAKLWDGGMATNDGKIIRFIAAGSTGELVERSNARFCGVMTGRDSYSNSGGGTTHAVRVVGMFDLPDNRKKAP